MSDPNPGETPYARLTVPGSELFETSPDVQLLCDRAGKVLARNKAARALGEAQFLSELFADPQELETLRKRNFLGADQRVLRLCLGHQVMLAAAPLLLEGVHCWQILLHDVTTHTLVGDQQQVTRQLAAVGRLGRLVSNEITSPLAVLLGRIELLQTLNTPPP